jgi:hypothetical protein
MEPMKLTDQQSLRVAEPPEDCPVVGVDSRAPLVRKPTGQVLRIQQNGRPTAATTEAKLRLADRGADKRNRLDASSGATLYTSVCG